MYTYPEFFVFAAGTVLMVFLVWWGDKMHHQGTIWPVILLLGLGLALGASGGAALAHDGPYVRPPVRPAFVIASGCVPARLYHNKEERKWEHIPLSDVYVKVKPLAKKTVGIIIYKRCVGA